PGARLRVAAARAGEDLEADPLDRAERECRERRREHVGASVVFALVLLPEVQAEAAVRRIRLAGGGAAAEERPTRAPLAQILAGDEVAQPTVQRGAARLPDSRIAGRIGRERHQSERQ